MGGSVNTANIASGVGSVLIQIAKRVSGVKSVIGIAGGKAKCDW